jgi:hypothetical protein
MYGNSGNQFLKRFKLTPYGIGRPISLKFMLTNLYFQPVFGHINLTGDYNDANTTVRQ